MVMIASANDAALCRRATRRNFAQLTAGHLLSLPAAVALLLLFVAPTIAIFGIALTDWQLGADDLSFIGLKNFRALLVDPDFYKSLRNSVVYTLLVLPATVCLGLAVALLIESGRSFRAFYRAAHFLPVMATMAAMAISWEALLHPTIGLLTQALASLGVPTTNWLKNQHTVLPALAAIGIWQNFGYAMVLFLAGLKVIPPDLYEAAAVDGADSAFDRLRTVTLPMLGPTTMFVTIIITLRSLEVFDTVSIITQGGPEKASEVLLYTLYTESFSYLRTGYGAAITVVFLLMVTSLMLLQTRIMDRRVHYA
ncbi:MAG: sugar ABC transporter permease [Steroidobacteraceae bacterium]